jgi:hypothetical protein
MSELLSILFALLIGALAAQALLGLRSSVWLRLSLVAPFGIGLVSIAQFTVMLLDVPRETYLLELVLTLILAGIIVSRDGAQVWSLGERSEGGPLGRAWWILLGAALLLAVLSLALDSALVPHGGADAHNIWNLRARFMARDPEGWRYAFTRVNEASHPDYPLLLPAAVARSWIQAGTESVLTPIVFAVLFALSAPLLLLASLRERGHGGIAVLLAVALIGTPGYLVIAAEQLADVPLSLFMLAAPVLAFGVAVPGRGRLLAAGLSAGLAAWTKNEGLVYAIFFVLVFAVLRWRQFATVLLGAAAPVAAVIAFKLFVPVSNDLVQVAGEGGLFGRLLDFERLWLVSSRFATDIFYFGNGMLLVLIALVLLHPTARCEKKSASDWVPDVLVLLQTAVYFAIFAMISEHPQSHLDTALARLLMQLWPLVIVGLAWSAWGSPNGGSGKSDTSTHSGP